MQQIITGNTEEQTIRTHYIEDILNEEFEPEFNIIEIEVITASGEIMNLRMSAKHIKRLQLFLQKEEMEERYFQFISKNY